MPQTRVNYMPLIHGPSWPDLVVEAIVLSPRLGVVVRNVGVAPVTDAFWVDLYLNPNLAPAAVNQIWPELATQGGTWGVTADGLPLAPGASLLLTVGDVFYQPEYSNLPAQLAAGTVLYAQVDSWNPDTSYGAVWENHERDGTAYNNLRGPVQTDGIITLSAPSAAVQERNAFGLPVRADVRRSSATPWLWLPAVQR